MKKISAILLIFVLVLAFFPASTSVSAAEADIGTIVFPKPSTPNYMKFESDPTNEFASDALLIYNVTDRPVLEISAEYYADSDAFYEKYGLYSFNIGIQYDSSLDNLTSWKYNSEWDSQYNAPGTGSAAAYLWADEEMVESFYLADLYLCGDGELTDLAAAISSKHHNDGTYEWDTYYFDTENHSLNIRRRYYMEWETADNIGEIHSTYSEWSDIAVFGKNSTAITPTKPTGYEAPTISDFRYAFPSEYSNGQLYYKQTTPDSAYQANIYYNITGDGYYYGLETQISVNGGAWQEYNTVDSGGDWCLWDGIRYASYETPEVNPTDHIKLRIRFYGSDGYSPWSNVAEINIPALNKGDGDVNGDGSTDNIDASLILKYDAGIIDLTDEQLKHADVTGEGEVNNIDAAMILKYDAGIIEEF